MVDKSLSIFLIVLFGISGIAILILAWVWPMPASERILTIFVGSSGLLMSLIRVLMLKSLQAKPVAEQVAVEVQGES